MKKPTTKQLQAQLDEANATIARLQSQLQLREAEVSGLKASQAEHDSTMTALVNKVRAAEAAMRPFHEKTQKWDWPNDAIGAILPLTFGHLRAVRDTYEKIRA